MEDNNNSVEDTNQSTNENSQENNESQKDTNVHEEKVYNKEESRESEERENNKENFWNKQSKDKNNNEEKAKYEYNNCIFIDGATINNATINSGQINGNINQAFANSMKDKHKYILSEESDLSKFIEQYSGTSLLSIMISLSALKVIPLNLLYEIAGELNYHLHKSKYKEEGIELIDKSIDIKQPMEEILTILNAVKREAYHESELGRLPIMCITYNETIATEKICELLWKEYIYMREPIIEWLLSIKGIVLIRKMLSYQISDAVAEFSAYDFSYANLYVIPVLTNNETYNDTQYLVKIFRKALKVETYKENVDNLLCYWLRLGNDNLWRVAHQLYNKDEDYAFNKLLFRRLEETMLNDIKKGIRIDDDFYYINDFRSMNFNIMQDYPHMAEIFISTLCKLFYQSEKYIEKCRLCHFLCSLLWQDYLDEGFPSYKLIFIDCFNNKELRKSIKPVILFIWKKTKFRSNIEKMLISYVEEMGRNHRKWSYMEEFLKAIAFTGDSTDYYNTISLLDKSKKTYDGMIISEQMRDYLQNKLNTRKLKKE